MFAVSRKHSRDDIKIAMLFDKNGSAVASKIDQALNLISKFEPRRYQQIKPNLVKKLGLSAFYIGSLNAKWIREMYA
jgi:hypothetical protein